MADFAPHAALNARMRWARHARGMSPGKVAAAAVYWRSMTEEPKPNLRRLSPLPIRCTAEEIRELDQCAADAGQTRHEYCKDRLLGRRIVRKAERKNDAQILAATANIRASATTLRLRLASG